MTTTACRRSLPRILRVGLLPVRLLRCPLIAVVVPDLLRGPHCTDLARAGKLARGRKDRQIPAPRRSCSSHRRRPSRIPAAFLTSFDGDSGDGKR